MLADINAGLLGIGGGMIVSPLLLELGVHPLVAASTSSLMVWLQFTAKSLLPVSFLCFCDAQLSACVRMMPECGSVCKANNNMSKQLKFAFAGAVFGVHSGAGFCLRPPAQRHLRPGVWHWCDLCISITEDNAKFR